MWGAGGWAEGWADVVLAVSPSHLGVPFLPRLPGVTLLLAEEPPDSKWVSGLKK